MDFPSSLFSPLSSVNGNGQHKDDRHNDGGNVQRHLRISPKVPAREDRCMGQLDEQDVDDAHGPQQQGLDGNGQAEEDGDGQVAEHAGEEDEVEESQEMAEEEGVL